MKKILFTLFIAATSLAASAQSPKLSSMTDSIAYYLGTAEGSYTRHSVANNPNAHPDDAAAFEQAVKYVFSLPDSTDSYMMALRRAIELRTMVKDMARTGYNLDEQLLLNSFLAAINGPVKSNEELNELIGFTQGLMNRAANEARERAEAEKASAIAKNKADGEAFMTALKKKEKKNLHTTVSGLSYKADKKGYGPSPKENDKVKVHYTGKLIDGTVFDSSVERGEPATFGVSGLIKGFTEGLMLMNPGAKYTFYIPSELGYGDEGAGGGKIAPGATLVFDVELLEILPAE